VELTAPRVAVLLGALSVCVALGLLWRYVRLSETTALVERCSRGARQHGDELFLGTRTAAAAIDRLGGRSAAPGRLMSYLRSSGGLSEHRWAAIALIGRCGTEAAWTVPTLRGVLFSTGEFGRNRCAAALALGRIGGPDAVAHLTLAVRNRDYKVREYALKALARMNEPGVEPALVLAASDPWHWNRVVAARALGRVGSERSLRTLKDLALYDVEPQVRAAAYGAYRTILKRRGGGPLLAGRPTEAR
jgi:HEAT repeat protein